MSTNRSVRPPNAGWESGAGARAEVEELEQCRGSAGPDAEPAHSPWFTHLAVPASLRRLLRRPWVWGAALVVLTLLAYQPVWHAGFIWDDDVYVIRNKLLTAPDGLKRIWFSQDSPSQYFPLVYTMFRYEYAVWGLNPTGYHWINLLLHAANGLLVWQLLRRLRVPWAWLGAALFTLHPVQVESVAWVTERKNVLSLFFVLLCLLSWLRFVRETGEAERNRGEEKPLKRLGSIAAGNSGLKPGVNERRTRNSNAQSAPEPSEAREISPSALGGERAGERGPLLSRFMGSGGQATFEGDSAHDQGGVMATAKGNPWLLYVLAVVCYALALFSKTTACTLPAALVLVLWLEKRRLTLLRWAQIAPFILMGLAMGMLTMWWERHHIGTRGSEFAIPLLDRILIASRGVWFYLAKLVWPFHLAFSYPRWTVNASNPAAYGWVLLGGAAAVAVAYGRRWLGRGPEVAFTFFVATLTPTLGFIMLFTFRYTFVADHYQYVACLGPLALAGAGLACLWRGAAGGRVAFGRTLGKLAPALGGALLILLAGLTWSQARSYKDLETLWRDTVRQNPESWMARYNLSRDLLRRGKTDEALAEYREALKNGPDQVNGLVSLGNALFAKGKHDEAMGCYERALKLNPDCPEAHVNLAVILAGRGQLDEAIAHDRRAVQVNPLLLNARVNLAVGLASKGNLQEALEHYRKALEINPDQPMTHINLAIALEGLGQTNEARQHYQLAATAVNAHAAGLVSQGRMDEAILQYREALRMIPDNAEAHYALGRLLLRQGNREEARREFTEALRIKPGYAEAEQQLRAR